MLFYLYLLYILIRLRLTLYTMASKYIVILLILCVTGFFALGIKKLLLLRPGFSPEKKPINWVMIGLLALLTLFLISCNNKPNDVPAEETEREPVIVSQSSEKTSDIHKQVDNKGNVTATVTISTRSDNNEIITEEKVLKGTRQEVDAQIKALGKKQ